MSALWSIGPRQTTAASSSTKKPIDMTFTPLGLERQDLALGRDLRARGAEAEHARDRVAPDVGVEDADLLALAGERRGEVRGDRRLADAALARADAEDVARPAASAPSGSRAAAELLLQARPSPGR